MLRTTIDLFEKHLSGEEAWGLYSHVHVHVDAAGSGVGLQADGVLLLESGLDQALSAGLARWRKPTAVYDPAKIVLDLAVSLALGGDCLSDVAVLPAEPGVYGPVASARR